MKKGKSLNALPIILLVCIIVLAAMLFLKRDDNIIVDNTSTKSIENMVSMESNVTNDSEIANSEVESGLVNAEIVYADEPVYEMIDGCYKGVPLQAETMKDSWTKQVTFRASNGTYIKI